ncbi:MAG: hypothetical protein Q8L43_04395, partial [Deltaproteobacteria bacterium]|nr:hypothetical protein [Deltaproteobacteria bacterium]
MGNYYLNLSLPLSDGSWRPGYDFIGLAFLFFRLGFRHPAVFFATCHPLFLLARGRFQLCFLDSGGFE